jgi:hypothetical protein
MVLLDKACVGHVIYHGVPFTTSSSRHSFASEQQKKKSFLL